MRYWRCCCSFAAGITMVLMVVPGAGASGRSESVTITIDGAANIFGAGHSVPPDPGGGGAGELPPVYQFGVATGQVLRVSSVTGLISADGGVTYNGPDGSGGPISPRSWDGISGIRDDSGGFYLVGVFLNDSEPHDPALHPFTFTDRHSFSWIAPPIGKVFFVGDGMNTLGLPQSFYVPDGATRLFLGLADACNGQGFPGCYGDNLGLLEATFTVGS